MAKKIKRFSKLKTAGLIAAAAGTVGLLGVSFGGNKPINVPAYRAEKVIDGDTFDTQEHQLIRLASVDAPELSRCGGAEAKKELEKLVLNQDIYLKVIYRDSGRDMAIVYTADGWVEEKILESGWVEVHSLQFNGDKLSAIDQKIRREKKGIYSEQCTQAENPNNPQCNIKGNVGRNNIKSYHFPGCISYNVAVIELHHGDQWFCTEAAAKNAGFTRAERCPDHYEPTRLNLEGYQTK